jgi:predicted secreted acid phosphatase
MSKTIFIDLDGTLVFHNYHPNSQVDIFLPGAIEFLINSRSKGYYCVLTTNRSESNCKGTISSLQKLINFKFDRTIFDLPVGIRILINDNKDDEVRALAIPINRNIGLYGVDV